MKRTVDISDLLIKLGWKYQGPVRGTLVMKQLHGRWFSPNGLKWHGIPMGCKYATAYKTLREKGLLDPDANLEEQRELAKKLLDPENSDLLRAVWADRLSELVLSLDEWMAKGGFPPKAWKSPNS